MDSLEHAQAHFDAASTIDLFDSHLNIVNLNLPFKIYTSYESAPYKYINRTIRCRYVGWEFSA